MMRFFSVQGLICVREFDSSHAFEMWTPSTIYEIPKHRTIYAPGYTDNLFCSWGEINRWVLLLFVPKQLKYTVSLQKVLSSIPKLSSEGNALSSGHPNHLVRLAFLRSTMFDGRIRAVVYAEGQFDYGDSISFSCRAKVCSFLNLLVVVWMKDACLMIGVVQQCKWRAGTLTLDFVLGGLSSPGWKPSGWPSWLCWQWRLPSHSLVEGIVWRRDLSRMKTLNLILWLDRTTTVYVHRYLPKGVVLENLFRSLGIVTTGGAYAVCEPLFVSTGLFLFLLLFLFGYVHQWCLELLQTLCCCRCRV